MRQDRKVTLLSYEDFSNLVRSQSPLQISDTRMETVYREYEQELKKFSDHESAITGSITRAATREASEQLQKIRREGKYSRGASVV